MRISSLLSAYQQERHSSGYSDETIERVVLNITMYSRDMHVGSIERMTTESVLTWGGKKLNAGKKSSTVYAYYNSVKSFVKYLDEQGVKHEMDKDRIKCKPVYERMVCLRPNDVRRIVKCADYETGLLIRMMYSSGMRISEAISLKPSMVETEEVYIRGKGGKVRTVFITAPIANELQILKNGEEPFFCLNRSDAYYRIKKAMVDAGYPNAYPHSLRHTFTTTMLRQGATLSHVQRLLGHSQISTTQRYEHLVTDDIHKAHAKYLVKI